MLTLPLVIVRSILMAVFPALRREPYVAQVASAGILIGCGLVIAIVVALQKYPLSAFVR
jgi:hypothetical protein